MAVVLRYMPRGNAAEKYDQAIRRLESSGAGAPAGRILHISYGDRKNLRVAEVWDSRESFEKFGETLRPILKELGIEGNEPEFLEIHRMIAPALAGAGEPV